MSFEAQILLNTLLIPMLIVGITAGLLRWKFYKSAPIISDFVLLIAFSVAPIISMWLRGDEDLNWSDEWRQIPFAAMFAGLAGWLTSFEKFDIALRWLLRATAVSFATWWLLPVGEIWRSAADIHTFWMLIVPTATLWTWFSVESLNASKSTTPTVWVLGFCSVAAAVVAANDFASLSELSLAGGACVGGLAIASIIGFRKIQLGTTWVGFSLLMTIGTLAISRYYSYMPLPRYSYICIAAAPLSLTVMWLATTVQPTLGKRYAWLLISLTIAMTLVLLAVGIWPVLAEPEPEW